MRKSTTQRLREALEGAGVAPHQALSVLNTMYGAATLLKSPTHADPAWEALCTTIKYERRILRSNRSHWPVWIAPVYEEYVQIMDRVVHKIELAAFHPLAGQVSPPTLAEYTRHTKKVNAKRATQHQLPVGDRNKHWQSWVPQHIRGAFCDRVTATYDRQGVRKGHKFLPFSSMLMVAQRKQRVERLQGSIESVRAACSDRGLDTANTPFRALNLAAARMAEKALLDLRHEHNTGAKHMFDAPIPVHWMQLLSPKMRATLKAGYANPAAVDPSGLRDFYRPPPTPVLKKGQSAEDVAWLLDTTPMDDIARTGMTALMDEPAPEDDEAALTTQRD